MKYVFLQVASFFMLISIATKKLRLDSVYQSNDCSINNTGEVFDCTFEFLRWINEPWLLMILALFAVLERTCEIRKICLNVFKTTEFGKFSRCCQSRIADNFPATDRGSTLRYRCRISGFIVADFFFFSKCDSLNVRNSFIGKSWVSNLSHWLHWLNW